MGVLLLLSAGCSDATDEAAPPGHVEALLPGPDGAPDGWWSLDLEGGQAYFTDPAGGRFPIGEVIGFEDGELRLGADPNCPESDEGGTYAVSGEGDAVTFAVVDPDDCADRQDILTAEPWRTYSPPPLLSEVADPEPAEIVATIRLGARPAFLASEAGSVWVRTENSPTVHRIDPATNRVSAQVDADPADPYGWIGSGDGAVWVSHFTTHQVSRIDADTGAVTATIDVGVNPTGILVADGQVWVSNHRAGTVSRIDAAAASVTATVEVGDAGPAGPQVLTRGTGDIHVVVPRANEIRRIDPRSGAVSDFYTGRVSGRITENADGVWNVEGPAATWVSRLDRDGRIDMRVDVGRDRHPWALAATEDAVWVVTLGDGSPGSRVELVRIDPGTGEVTRRLDVADAAERHNVLVTPDGDVWIGTEDAVLRVDGG